MKLKVSPSVACKFRKAEKVHTFYNCGYYVRDTKDGYQYIVDFPTLLTSQDFDTIFEVFWEKKSDIIKAQDKFNKDHNIAC